MPQFVVTIVHDLAHDEVPDEVVTVSAETETQAALFALQECGGGPVDALCVSPPDSASVEVDSFGWLKETAFVQCTLWEGGLWYQARW